MSTQSKAAVLPNGTVEKPLKKDQPLAAQEDEDTEKEEVDENASSDEEEDRDNKKGIVEEVTKENAYLNQLDDVKEMSTYQALNKDEMVKIDKHLKGHLDKGVKLQEQAEAMLEDKELFPADEKEWGSLLRRHAMSSNSVQQIQKVYQVLKELCEGPSQEVLTPEIAVPFLHLYKDVIRHLNAEKTWRAWKSCLEIFLSDELVYSVIRKDFAEGKDICFREPSPSGKTLSRATMGLYLSNATLAYLSYSSRKAYANFLEAHRPDGFGQKGMQRIGFLEVRRERAKKTRPGVTIDDARVLLRQARKDSALEAKLLKMVAEAPPEDPRPSKDDRKRKIDLGDGVIVGGSSKKKGKVQRVVTPTHCSGSTSVK
jgi:hypothetical protein